jgi:hypothetical protein
VTQAQVGPESFVLAHYFKDEQKTIISFFANLKREATMVNESPSKER